MNTEVPRYLRANDLKTGDRILIPGRPGPAAVEYIEKHPRRRTVRIRTVFGEKDFREDADVEIA